MTVADRASSENADDLANETPQERSSVDCRTRRGAPPKAGERRARSRSRHGCPRSLSVRRSASRVVMNDRPNLVREVRIERKYEPNRAAMLAAVRIVLRLPPRVDDEGNRRDD